MMKKEILTRFSLLSSFFITVLIMPLYAHAQIDALPQGEFSSLAQETTRTVTDVIDPLTLKLDDGRYIHLTGLDYPDLDYYSPGQISLTAIKILKDFLLNKKVIVYQTKNNETGRMNRMGHHIAHLVRKNDQSWVQGTLISLGLARVRTTKSNPEMAEQMYAIERIARKNKAGLWDIDGYGILTPDEADSRTGSFAIIEGPIYSAAMKSNRLYLNFGQNWRTDFTVSISASDRRSFNKAGIDPMQWNGKTIRVRGWIASYNGPYIEIDHPERFELIFENEVISEEPDIQKTNTITHDKDEASDITKKDGSGLPMLP